MTHATLSPALHAALHSASPGTWAWPSHLGERGLLVLVALLRTIVVPTSANVLRTATVLANQPRLAEPFLTWSDRAAWESAFRGERLADGERADVGRWVRSFLARGAIVEDMSTPTTTWAPGAPLDRIDGVLGADEWPWLWWRVRGALEVVPAISVADQCAAKGAP